MRRENSIPRDPVTELYSISSFLEIYQHWVSTMTRGVPTSIVALSPNNFNASMEIEKPVLAEYMAKLIREGDWAGSGFDDVFREYTFFLISPNLKKESSTPVIERMQKKLDDISRSQSLPPLSINAGISSYMPEYEHFQNIRDSVDRATLFGEYEHKNVYSLLAHAFAALCLTRENKSEKILHWDSLRKADQEKAYDILEERVRNYFDGLKKLSQDANRLKLCSPFDPFYLYLSNALTHLRNVV